MILLLSWLVHCLLILLSVAFFTLFERKVMGLFHNRLGPNKVSFIGIVQPLLDAFKLLTKQSMTPLHSNLIMYNLSPQFSLFISLFVWLTLPFFFVTFVSLNYSFLVFFCIGSVSVLAVLFSGWSSNSKYSLIGSLRSIAQSISYESVMSTLIVMFMYLIMSYSMKSFTPMSSLMFMVIFFIWLMCVLGETHRAPFDFSESESELVSGFNTEFSGAYFAFLFLSEYSMILFSCFLMTYMFLGFLVNSVLSSSILYMGLLVVVSLLFSFILIWIRITFCRFRYDLLMMSAWKEYLPVALFFYLVFLTVSFL